MEQDFYKWPRLKEAEDNLQKILASLKSHSSFLTKLEKLLIEETSTDLFAWVDHLVLNEIFINPQQLEKFGYEISDDSIFSHSKAYFPIIKLSSEGKAKIAIKVECIEDFLMMHSINTAIDNPPYTLMREAIVDESSELIVSIIERHGYYGLKLDSNELCDPATYIECLNLWKSRPRSIENELSDIQEATKRAKLISQKVGTGHAADIVLRVERDYWQARNYAGTVQKMRQDSIGLGWANHDHHTFRSSRESFMGLIGLFKEIGFYCREKFYAGKEAGWGAQVMEHTDYPFVLFLDVDLSPEEIQIDFAHTQLKKTDKLGTIGLWCRLHGSSIVKAGMHHLEAQFNFDKLAQDLKKGFNIDIMDPFSNFPYLKQAFTQGQMWNVDPLILKTLLSEGHINQKEYDVFVKDGAIGSHLENLERHEGYKGFNQKNVSDIIERTDPRRSMD